MRTRQTRKFSLGYLGDRRFEIQPAQSGRGRFRGRVIRSVGGQRVSDVCMLMRRFAAPCGHRDDHHLNDRGLLGVGPGGEINQASLFASLADSHLERARFPGVRVATHLQPALHAPCQRSSTRRESGCTMTAEAVAWNGDRPRPDVGPVRQGTQPRDVGRLLVRMRHVRVQRSCQVHAPIVRCVRGVALATGTISHDAQRHRGRTRRPGYWRGQRDWSSHCRPLRRCRLAGWSSRLARTRSPARGEALRATVPKSWRSGRTCAMRRRSRPSSTGGGALRAIGRRGQQRGGLPEHGGRGHGRGRVGPCHGHQPQGLVPGQPRGGAPDAASRATAASCA